jgi:hypothetical protein
LLWVVTGIGFGAIAGFTAGVGFGILASMLLRALGGPGWLATGVLFWACVAGIAGGAVAGGIAGFRRGRGSS